MALFLAGSAVAADTAQATSLPSCLPFRQRLQGVLLDHGRIDLQICDTTGHSEVRRSGVGSAMRQVWGNACMRTWASAHGAQARTGQVALPARRRLKTRAPRCRIAKCAL